MPRPAHGPCHRCGRTRTLFPAPATWGKTPTPLCPRCWSAYADARAAGTYADAADAFDNAPDSEWEAALAHPRAGR